MVRTFFLILLFGAWMFFYQNHATNPGEVTFEFSGFIVETTALFLMTALFFLVLLTFYWGQVWHFLAELPKRMRESYSHRRINEGLTNLYKGFEALAAGDVTSAKKFAKRTNNLLPDGRLSAMLQAEVASLNGDEALAQLHFKELSEDEKDPFLGLKGLLEQLYRQKKYIQALEVAEKAYKLRPKSAWAMEKLFEIYMHTSKFEEALNLLPSLKGKANYTEDQLKTFECALRMQLANSLEIEQPKEALKHIEKGLKVVRSFVPLVLKQARILENTNDIDRAEKVLTNFWRENPSDKVLKAWLRLVKENHADKVVKKAKALTKSLIDEPQGAMAMADIYMAENDLENARTQLVAALRMEKNRKGYRLLSEIDDELKGGNAGYKWLKKAWDQQELEPLFNDYVAQYDAWRKKYVLGEEQVQLGAKEHKVAGLLEA